MSLIRTLRNRDRTAPTERALWGLGNYPSWVDYAGIPANAGTVEQALRNAATWACIDVLADAISRTPLDVVRYDGTTRIPVQPTPKIVAKPSGLVSADVWRYQLAHSLLTDGNAFGLVTIYNGTWPTQIELLAPETVGNRTVTDGVATVSVNGKQLAVYPHGPVWHVPGRMIAAGSPYALSPIAHAAKVTGTSLAAEDFSNRFFTDGAHPTVVATMERDPGDEGAKAIKRSIIASTRGNREPLVFGGGKIDRLQVPPGETQFIELMRYEVEQTCRFWRVPPSMVYAATSGQNVTYANVSQADLHYLKHSLDGYYVRIEHALTATIPDELVVRANRAAILRADQQARYDAYEVALRNKFTTIDEVRALEDQEPLPDQLRIDATDAETIGALIRAGYQAESVIAAVTTGDLTKLVHTGRLPVTVQSANGSGSVAP